jgi:hypothetical protein
MSGVSPWGASMRVKMGTFRELAQGYTYYDGLTRWFIRERIGHGLRERYEVPKELPLKLLALVRRLDAVEDNQLSKRSLIGKLDAVEGNYLSRYAPPAEPHSAGPSDDGDWPFCT